MSIMLKHKKIKNEWNGFQIYQGIVKGEDQIFLDSSKENSPFSQYSIIGVNPFLAIKYENGKIYFKDFTQESPNFRLQADKTDIFDCLNQIIQEYKIVNDTPYPFVGGALGYFSYDLGQEVENIVFSAETLVEIPDVYFVFYDNAVIIDHKLDELIVTGLNLLKPTDESISEIIEKIKAIDLVSPNALNSLQSTNNSTDGIIVEGNATKPVFKSPFSSDEYQAAVEKMREYIREGHIYIANMTHTFSSEFKRPGIEIYERLRQINPAPFSAYLPLDGFSILSSSPERFIEIKSGKIQTRPIKGTRPRGKTPEEDEFYKNELIMSEKDKSELLMIVDLERNDLSKVCIPGTVKVTELFKIETYATVFHLVSTIEGKLENGKTPVDCIKATFPGGSITGAPKIRAMEIIDELEKNKRNIYTGAIGYLGFDGNADFNIVIRTILLKDEMAYIGVGGGITWESEALSEYDETIDKAVALFKSLGADYVS